jgi:hypothetical protein
VSSPPTRLLAAGFLASLLANALLLAAFHDAAWWPPDEGNYAHVAERILNGDVLNRDVQDVHAGAINFLNAAALGLFGRSLVALRYPLALAALASGALLFYLFRSRGPWLAAAAALAPVALGVLQFLNPTAHWYSLLLFFLIVACLEEVPPAARGRTELLGFLAGALFLFRQLSGVLVAIGLVAWLLAEPSQDSPGRPRGRLAALAARATLAVAALGLAGYLLQVADPAGFALFGAAPLALLLGALMRPAAGNRRCLLTLARLTAGAAVAFAPLVLYHAVHGSLASWYQDTVLAPARLASMEFIDDQRFSALIGRGLAALLAPASAAEAVNGVFWMILPFAAALLGGLVIRGVLGMARRGTGVGALPFLAVFYAVVSLHYQIPIYLFYTLGATLAGLLWLAGERGRWTRTAAVAAVLALSAVGVAFHAGQPILRTWDHVMAGRREPLVSSVVPSGLARCGLRITPEDRALYAGLVALIERETAPGEEIFAVPSNAELYFLAGRPNPFRFFNFALGVSDRASADAVAERLRSRPPRLVFYNPKDKYNTPLSREVMATVAASYELLGERGPFRIYRAPRRAD